jgi:hypothetical protein
MEPQRPPTPTPNLMRQSLEHPRSSKPPPSSRPAHIRRRIEGTQPEIEYIVQDVDDQLDFENPLPAFENSTVAQFLNLFSERSGIGLDFIEKVTFTLIFKDHTTLTLNRWDSEQSWERIKTRIRGMFKLVRKRRPNNMDFDVHVGVDDGVRGGKDGG